MKIPTDRLVIPAAKLTHYLLVERDEDDKSKFLAQAGFTLENPAALENAIRQLAARTEAEADRTNEFGVYYQIKGDLSGPNGYNLAVITVWLDDTQLGMVRFITLKPWKTGRKSGNET